MDRRLTIQEFAEWRRNTILLVSKDGEVARDATQEEIKRGGEVTLKGVSYLLIGSRELLTRQLLKEAEAKRSQNVRGATTVNLKAPNGRFLKRLRPALKEKPLEPRQGTVPHPDFCQCKDFAGREPGRHHHICAFAKLAPIHERATKVAAQDIRKHRLFVPSDPNDITVRSNVAKPVVEDGSKPRPALSQDLIPSPSECVCIDWAWNPAVPRDDGHNPICEWRDKWRPDIAKSEGAADGLDPLSHEGVSPDIVKSGGPADGFDLRSAGDPSGGRADTVEAEGVELIAEEGEVSSTDVDLTVSAPETDREGAWPPAPEDCECRTWPGAKPGEHHPTCQFYGVVENPYYLFLAKTGQKTRIATDDEVAEAIEYEQKNGLPLITIGDDVYYCKTAEATEEK